ncbi:replicative DNA helicase [Streptomyces albidoflavus]
MSEDTSTSLGLPHDLTAEQILLGAMLRTPNAVTEVVEDLDGSRFYRPAHELIYTGILTVYAQGQTPDPLNVRDALAKDDLLDQAGGLPYLNHLAHETPRTMSWQQAAQRVLALSTLRRTREAAAHIDNLVAEGTPESVDEVINTAQAEIFAATAQHRSSLPPDRPLGDILEGVLDEIEGIATDTDTVPGISTGFHDLDNLTNGLHPGQLIVLAGRPAMGCSTLALNLARTAAVEQRLPTVFFSLAADRNQVAMRLLAAEARVPLHHMRGGSLKDTDWERLARRMPDVSSAPLFIQDDIYSNFVNLRSHCRRLRARQDIRLIVVDDLHLLHYGTRPLTSRYEEISEISRCLKLLAKELAVPVVAVSTLNRSPEQRTDKKPWIADLRDSGALEDNADLVILLHREDAYERESPRAGEADLLVVKHTQGPTADVTIAFQGHYSRFVDMAHA